MNGLIKTLIKPDWDDSPKRSEINPNLVIKEEKFLLKKFLDLPWVIKIEMSLKGLNQNMKILLDISLLYQEYQTIK